MWLLKGKQILITLAFTMLSFGLMAQHLPMYSQYMWHPASVNPAFTGVSDGLQILAVNRNQWVNFDGAPKTQSLLVNQPIKLAKVGLGLQVQHDAIGVSNRTAAMASYSYGINWEDDKVLRFGVQVGFNQFVNSWDKLILNDLNDPSFDNASEQFMKILAGAGIAYYNKKDFVGLALPNFFSTIDENNNASKFRHIYLNAGTSFVLNDDFDLKTSALLKTVRAVPTQLDINASVIFKNIFWLGMGYRTNQAIVFLTRLQMPSEKIWLAYSYDINTSQQALKGHPTHELAICFQFIKETKKVLSPRYF